MKEHPELYVRFDELINKIVPRYLSLPGHKHDKTYANLYKDFPNEYEEWLSMRSFVDRRSIAYRVLDGILNDSLELWQRIERYNDDRCPLKALEVACVANDKQKAHINYWSALAKTYFVLTSYDDAAACCDTALKMDKTDVRALRIYADVLHETNRQVEAHEIYQQIINDKYDTDHGSKVTLVELLGFDGDAVNSPIYALAWLNNDENVSDEHWQWADIEFHYSPHFRCEHAYKKLKDEKYLEGISALVLVSREMPWYKEGVLNSLELINKMNLSPYLSKDKIRLEKIIEANKWNKYNNNPTCNQ